MEDLARPTILLIDDTETNLDVLVAALGGEYRLAVALDGESALHFLERNLPDLILLDVIMPGIDGYEVCRRIKENPRTVDIPVLFLTAVDDVEGKTAGFEAGAVDYITKPFNVVEVKARVRTHLQLKRSMEQLKEEVRERLQAESKLKKSEQSLREANAAKDKFFSIIAHDLKNPFNSLLGFSELLLSRYEAFEEAQRKEFIQDINSALKHLYNLLENLLQWSRVQTDKIEWRPEVINLPAIIDESVSLLRRGAESKGIRLHMDLAGDAPAYADPNMVRMVIRNLASNAVKFTPRGGEVRISIRSLEGFQEVVVADTGVGMTPEHRERLFRIDVHQSRLGTENEKGTGLGLILCREFVETNGGAIQVESAPGKGSKFRFTVPQPEIPPH